MAYLPHGTCPTPRQKPQKGDWSPFRDRIEFELGELLFKKMQSSKGNTNLLMDLWAASLVQFGACPPFASQADLLAVIDSIPHGEAPWECFVVKYAGPLPAHGEVPSWMTQEYLVWTRNPRTLVQIMVSNEDFDGEFDYVPYCELNEEGKQRLTNLFSGNWAWRQAVRPAFQGHLVQTMRRLTSVIFLQDIIAEDPATHGAMFVPVILGSDKTTVTVATGQNEYYPLYLSIGNVHNAVRRAHRNAVQVLAFLAIPHGQYLYVIKKHQH